MRAPEIMFPSLSSACWEFLFRYYGISLRQLEGKWRNLLQDSPCTISASKDCGVMSSPVALSFSIVFFEDTSLLDLSCEVHIFCLHYVYLVRVNTALHQFCDAWNNHPLSSERNMSPVQLWITGLTDPTSWIG